MDHKNDINGKIKSKLSIISIRSTIRVRIVLLSVLSLVVMMGSSIVSPSITLYAKQGLGANEFLVGAVIAGFALGRLIFDIPSGILTARLGTDKTILLGLGVLIVSSIAAGFASNFWILIAARIVEGIGSSIYVSGAITFVLLSGEPSMRGPVMGKYQSIMMLGPIIGPIVGAPVATLYGLNSPYFVFAGIVSLALIVVVLLSYKGKLDVKISQKIGEHATYQIRDVRAITTYFSTASIATFGFAFLRSGVYTTAMPLFAYGYLHLSIVEVGVIFALTSLANLLASFFSSKLTVRFGMERPLIFSLSFAAVIAFIIPFSSTMIELLILISVIGTASGFFGQSVAWAADQVEEKVTKKRNEKGDVSSSRASEDDGGKNSTGIHIAKGVGFNRTIGDMGLILGPLFVGTFIATFSNQSTMWVLCFGGIGVVLATISLLLNSLNKRNLLARLHH